VCLCWVLETSPCLMCVCVDALLRGDNSKTRQQHHYEALRLCLNARDLCGDHVNRSPHQVEERSLKAVG